MTTFLDYLWLLLAQFAGGPGPKENNLVRFGLAAIFWAVLLAIAWSRQRKQDLPREKLLVWGFGMGFLREAYMFAHVSMELSGLISDQTTLMSSEPLEHALALASAVVIAVAFLRYTLNQPGKLPLRYLQIGLITTVLTFLVTARWWSQLLEVNSNIQFHQTWAAWPFHIIASIIIAAAIFLLLREPNPNWLNKTVALALGFLFLAEFGLLFNFATSKAFSYMVCPICNSFHILAIPVLGYVYLREQAIEKQQAEDALKAYRDQLEELVSERTEELTQANSLLKQEIDERIQVEKSLAELSQRNESILNSAGEGIFGVNLQGEHLFVNTRGAMMLGYAPDELIGKPSHATWHHSRSDGSPYPEEECPLHTGYKTGVVCQGDDQVFWRKDGSSFPVQYTSTPIFQGSSLTGAVVVFRDITQLKKQEAEINLRNAELAAQNALSATISQSLKLGRILNIALDQTLAALEIQTGALFLLDNGRLALQAHRGIKKKRKRINPKQLRPYQEVAQEAIAKQKPVLSEVSADDLESEISILISTPLVSKGKALGALTFGSPHKKVIKNPQVEMLIAIGQQVGMAVENANLYRQSERRAEELALLQEVSTFLTSTLDPINIYTHMTEQATKLTGCHVGHVFRWENAGENNANLSGGGNGIKWEEAEEKVVGIASHGSNRFGVKFMQLSPTAPENLLFAQIRANRRPVVINASDRATPIPPNLADLLSDKSILALPILGMQSFLGYLFLVDHDPRRDWQPEEIALVESFVNRAGIALENAYMHRQLNWAAALEERQRIAAEMHDGLAQTLSYMGHQVDQADAFVGLDRLAELPGKFQEMRRAIDQASKEVRLSIASLQESPQPPQPLQTWLNDIAYEFSRKHQVPIQPVDKLTSPLFLSVAEFEQVNRVVQEALLNACRHADAEEITIELERASRKSVALTVAALIQKTPATPKASILV